MAKYTITPWRSRSDLLAVRRQLYRMDTQDSRRHAVNRVMAWRLRGNLPHAVESTALLVDAFIHHDNDSNSSFSIRAVYSAAFCRFVTGFCDIGRNRERSLEPSSMLEIARQIDMPEEFVALRHEATHEDLPSVHRLVNACEDALRWLWAVYWSRLDESDDVMSGADHANHTSGRQEDCIAMARKMFKDHRITKRQLLKSKRPNHAAHAEVVSRASDDFVNVVGVETHFYELTATDLVEKQTLLPSDREMGSPLEGAFMLWDDLLQAICHRSLTFLKSLIHALLVVLTDQSAASDSQREAHCKWLEHLACSISWSDARQRSKADIPSTIMRTCICYPNTWCTKLGSELLANGGVEFADSWSDILNASKPPSASADVNGVGTSDPTHPLPIHGQDENQASVEAFREWQRTVLSPSTPIGVAGPL